MKPNRSLRIHTATALLLVAGLAGCATGPDATVVSPPEAVAAVREALAAVLSGHAAGRTGP